MTVLPFLLFVTPVRPAPLAPLSCSCCYRRRRHRLEYPLRLCSVGHFDLHAAAEDLPRRLRAHPVQGAPGEECLLNSSEKSSEDDDNLTQALVQYLFSEVNYGGRITDDKDRRLNNNILESFICKESLAKHCKLSPSGDAPYTDNDAPYNDNCLYLSRYWRHYQRLSSAAAHDAVSPRRRCRCAHCRVMSAQDTSNHAAANPLQILPLAPPTTSAGTYIIPKYETQQEALDFLKTLPVNPAPEVFGLSVFSKVASSILLPDFEAYHRWWPPLAPPPRISGPNALDPFRT